MEINTEVLLKVNNLDLQQIEARVARKKHWSKGRMEKAIENYRKFLYIVIVRGAVEPSKDVDEIWHAHILFTEKYAKDSSYIAGRFIHHRPYELKQANGAICSEACDACACEDKPGTKVTVPFELIVNDFFSGADSVNQLMNVN